MHNLGHTRSSSARDHLLHAPDAFVRTPLPGLSGGAAVVHVAPAFGAAFTQYTLELESGGVFQPAPTSVAAHRFLYVLSGEATLLADRQQGSAPHALFASDYACIPPAAAMRLAATSPARVAVIEKPYRPLAGCSVPGVVFGREHEVVSTPLDGDPDLQVRALLPPSLAFDFAVNTMTYQPGASLRMVEVHVMEHGLLMLEGGGIYRLGDAWYPVAEGDFIWMAPFCPQWFGALGKRPAKYLIYKDWNRHPLD